MALPGLLLVLAGVALLAIRWQRDQGRERRLRAEFFAGCEDVLQNAAIVERQGDFPRLSGTFHGHRVSIVPLMEGLAPRKLPSLWLLVTMHAPGRAEAMVDILMRPLGIEYYAPFAELPFRMETPAGWPPHAVVKTDNPRALPDPACLEHIGALLADPHAKEVLLAPDKVRIVWQAAEADRSNYLMLRQARFPVARLDPRVLQTLLDFLLPLAMPVGQQPSGDMARMEVAAA